MNKKQFIDELEKLSIKITDKQFDLLEEYYKILTEYNNHTNITRIVDKEDVYLKHFYDSLIIGQVVDLTTINSLLDIGSGAGFPGLVLKIVYPNIKLTLLDSNNKKTKFLELVVNKLELSDVEIINQRAEDHAKSNLNTFDLVTARAVAYADIITELSIPFIKLDGKVILMKGNNDSEVALLKKYRDELNIKNIDIYEYQLPIVKDNRILVTLTKNNISNNIKSYPSILKDNKRRTNVN